MKLIQLRYFIEVCRWDNNITKAAEECHISQPTISNAIKDLECEFGVLLFRRANGRLHITPEGERFLLEAHELLRKADELAQTMRGVGIEKKKILIGLTPMVGAFIFPELCRRFTTQYPDTEFELLEQGSIETHELLQNKKIDLELNINFPGDSTQFRSKHLLHSQYCLCVHREHPLAGASAVSVEDLSQVELALLSGNTFHAELIVNLFSSRGLQPTVLARSNQLQTIIQMVRNGMAASFFLKEIEQVYPELVAIPVQEPLPAEICMLWNKDASSYHRVHAFIQFLKNEFEGALP